MGQAVFKNIVCVLLFPVKLAGGWEPGGRNAALSSFYIGGNGLIFTLEPMRDSGHTVR